MNKERFGKLKQVFKGSIFTISQRDVFFPDGKKKLFEYCLRPDSVTILPFDSQGRLLLIKEYRHGFKKSVWFLPGGRVDKGESALRAAKRELREEAGFGAKTFKKVYQKFPSNTVVWTNTVFVAKDLFPAPLTGDESFPIEVVPTPFAKAVKMALDGTIKNEFIAFHIIRFDYMMKHGQFKW